MYIQYLDNALSEGIHTWTIILQDYRYHVGSGFISWCFKSQIYKKKKKKKRYNVGDLYHILMGTGMVKSQ